jgi:hypothetical protein
METAAAAAALAAAAPAVAALAAAAAVARVRQPSSHSFLGSPRSGSCQPGCFSA